MFWNGFYLYWAAFTLAANQIGQLLLISQNTIHFSKRNASQVYRISTIYSYMSRGLFKNKNVLEVLYNF